MNRRQFVKTTGFGLASLATPVFNANLPQVLAGSAKETGGWDITRPLDVKIGLKPVYGQRIPEKVHEGPCRPASPVGWNRQAEIENSERNFRKWAQSVKENAPPKANMLEPVYIQYPGDHRIDEKQWEKLQSDLKKTDLYYVHYRVPQIEKFGKPLAFVGARCSTVDVPAGLKARDREAYGLYDDADLAELVAALQVRKALAQTKMLIVTNGKWDYEYNVVRSELLDLDNIRERFGTQHQYIDLKEFFGELDKVLQDKQARQKVESITDNVISGATAVHMSRQAVLASVNFYVTACRLMEKYGCNTFTCTCQEMCVSGYPAKYKVTPCLTHSLLKSAGYASACERDTNVLLSMALLMYASDCSPYMGNTLVHDENLVGIHHDVPATKMKGFDTPELPYEVRNFCERGWGATMRYDFSRDKGEPVTFCRLDPAATKLLVVRGTMDGCAGFDRWGCSLRALIKVENSRDFFEKETEYGHHFAMVYGDHTRRLQRVCRVLGIEMVRCG